MTLRQTKKFFMAGFAPLLLSSPAFALDGDAMMSKLEAAYATYGVKLTTDSVQTEGTTVTAKGMKFSVENKDKPISVPLGDVVFSDVEESDDGGYFAGSVAFKDVDVTNEGVHLTAKDLNIQGLSIPDTPSLDSIDGMVLYQSAHAGSVVAENNGKRVFEIASSDAHVNIADDNSKIDFDTTIAGIWADLSDVKDPKSQEAINKLGLTNVNGQIKLAGSWEAATGKMDLTEYSMDVRDVGKINLAFSLSGYTQAFMKALQDATKAAAENPDKKAADAAMGMTMMGLLQQLTFNSASIRFDDASITKRVLDYVAGQQGITGDALAQQLKGMVPIMMAQLNMPDLQNQVSTAVNKFLDDPKNLEVKAAPASPVAFPMIMGAAMGAPQTLPQVLGVSVNANQ